MSAIIAVGGWVAAAVVAACCARLVQLRRRGAERIAALEAERTQRERRPAIISHEIHTPLALVRGAAELLAEQRSGRLTGVQAEFVATIIENTQQISGIAENFLADVRLDAADLAREQVDVRAVVASAARELRQIAPVPIRVDARGGTLTIWADGQLIRQVVWNLVNNAVRHTGADATVTVRVTESEGGGALISVSDDGSGMSEADLRGLFTLFETGSTGRPGSGIGMSVTQKIVHAHGGKVLVDSLVGRGTAVHVLLPVGAGPDGADQDAWVRA